MGAPAKFLFDVDFAAGARERGNGAAEHAAELAEAEAAAYRRGYVQAKAKPGRDQPPPRRRSSDASRSRLAARFAASKRGSNAKPSRSRSRSPASLRRADRARAVGEISAAARLLPQLVATPHSSCASTTRFMPRPRTARAARAHAASRAGLVVLAEPGIGVGDCRIEWADGGVKRSAPHEGAIANRSAAISRPAAGRRNGDERTEQ